MADSHDGHHDVDATFELAPPNYTQLPNIVLDHWMAELGDAELRTLLTLSRGTFGFHRSTVEMTLLDIAERAGLSERSVRRAVERLEARGLVCRAAPRYRPSGRRAPTSYTVNVRGMPPPDTAPPDGDKRATDEHHDESSLPDTESSRLPDTESGYMKETTDSKKPTDQARADGGGNRPTQEHHDGTAVGSVSDCTRPHVNGHDHVNGAVNDSIAAATDGAPDADGTPDGDGTGAVDAEIVTLLRAAGVRAHTARKLADGSHSLGEVRAAIAGCIERELGGGAVVNALRRGWYADAEPLPLPLPPPATVADAVEYVRATRLGLSDAIAEMAARWPETAAMADAVREQVRADGVAQWAARVQAREERLEDCPASIRAEVARELDAVDDAVDALMALDADAPPATAAALEARWRSAATEMASGELRRAVAAGDGEAECEALDELMELSCGVV